MTDIQEYYANTGALKKAAENRKGTDMTGQKKKVALSVIEAFGSGGPGGNESNVLVKDVEDGELMKVGISYLDIYAPTPFQHHLVLRLEYRSKFLNPKWRDAMLQQGSGGAYEISQRFTAMVGWAATAEVDNFVFDQAAERYALDEEVAKKLQKNNPGEKFAWSTYLIEINVNEFMCPLYVFLPEAFKNVVRRLLEANGMLLWKHKSQYMSSNLTN